MAHVMVNIEYWSKRYANNDIPWHKNYFHPSLEQHYQKLIPEEDKVPSSKPRIFVPLCGKTPDMIWLAEKGFQVVGVEAVEQAILDFFNDNSLAYDVKTLGADGVKCYSSLDESKDICIYEMDVFKVTRGILGGAFDSIWDKGSLSAIGLYVEDRGRRYADIISSLLRPNGRIMIENIIWFEDPGPNGSHPSHVPESVLRELFGTNFDITPLLNIDQSRFVKRDKYNKVYNLMTLKTKQQNDSV